MVGCVKHAWTLKKANVKQTSKISKKQQKKPGKEGGSVRLGWGAAATTTTNKK
jgi:hypothetical protein